MCELFDPVEFKQKLEKFYTYNKYIHELLPKNKDVSQVQLMQLGHAMTMFLKSKQTVDSKLKKLQASDDAKSNIIMQKRKEVSKLIQDTHKLNSADMTQKKLKDNLLDILQYLQDIFEQNAHHKTIFQQLFDHMEKNKSSLELYWSEHNDLLHTGFTYMNDSIDTIKTEQEKVNKSMNGIKEKQDTMHIYMQNKFKDTTNRLGKLEENHEKIELYHAEQNDLINKGFIQIDEQFVHMNEKMDESEKNIAKKMDESEKNIEKKIVKTYEKMDESEKNIAKKMDESEKNIAKKIVKTYEKMDETEKRMQEGFKQITDTTNKRANLDQSKRDIYDQDNNTRLCAAFTVTTLAVPGVPIVCSLVVGGVSIYQFCRSIHQRSIIDK